MNEPTARSKATLLERFAIWLLAIFGVPATTATVYSPWTWAPAYVAVLVLIAAVAGENFVILVGRLP